MPRRKPTVAPESDEAFLGHTFLGRPVRKSVYQIGVAGEIVRTGTDPEIEPESRVTFTTQATLSAIKGKFSDDGGVTMGYILTIDPDTFTIGEVVPPPPPDPTLLDPGEE